MADCRLQAETTSISQETVTARSWGVMSLLPPVLSEVGFSLDDEGPEDWTSACLWISLLRERGGR